jgi:hypothetical protein
VTHTKEIAAEILRQMGGSKFIVMTGSYNFIADGNTLCMKLRRNKSRANILYITLNSMDTYDMRFAQFSGTDVKDLRIVEGVYDDQIQEIFTDVTGMYTHL